MTEHSFASKLDGYPEVCEQIFRTILEVLKTNKVEPSDQIAFEISEKFRKSTRGNTMYVRLDKRDIFTANIAEFSERVLQKHQIKKCLWHVVSSQIVDQTCNVFGGCVLYIPSFHYERKLRDSKLCSEFKGNNINELSIKYSLSSMQVRNILKKYNRNKTSRTHGEWNEN